MTTDEVCVIQYELVSGFKSFLNIWVRENSTGTRDDERYAKDLVRGTKGRFCFSKISNKKADVLDRGLTSTHSFRSYQTTTFSCLFLWAVSAERSARTHPSWAEAGAAGTGSSTAPTINMYSSFQGVWVNCRWCSSGVHCHQIQITEPLLLLEIQTNKDRFIYMRR